jgi:hypothetical protein
MRDEAVYIFSNIVEKAEEKRRREWEAKQKETEENYKEMLNNATGVFLTETPDVFNIGGGHK